MLTAALREAVEGALDVANRPDPEGGTNAYGTALLVRSAMGRVASAEDAEAVAAIEGALADALMPRAESNAYGVSLMVRRAMAAL